jgi:hypothetical protein
MRAYIPVAAKTGLRQQWIVLSIDEDRRCEALEVHDSLEACLGGIDRLNALAAQSGGSRTTDASPDRAASCPDSGKALA